MCCGFINGALRYAICGLGYDFLLVLALNKFEMGSEGLEVYISIAPSTTTANRSPVPIAT